MTEKIDIDPHIKLLKDYYRRILLYEGIAVVVFGFLYFFLKESFQLEKQPALMLKSIFFAIFLIAFPSLLSNFHSQVNKLHTGMSIKLKIEKYKKGYYFLNNSLFALFILCLIAFMFTGDYFVLVFLLADLFFIVYERPRDYRIKEILTTPDEV